ncbi:MAG TPA: DUF1801 domain-containing protein [Thermoplasmata archaeon]|nr:DUF1801 domain-containing protein [Thermoplasmata archaeon]
MGPPAEGARAVAAYLDRLPAAERAALQRLRRLIRAAAPEAEEALSYRMPCFRWNGPLVYYAAFRDHLSFYPGRIAEIRRRFASALKPYEFAKGTLRFTVDRPIPARLITQIVKARVEENARRRGPAPAHRERPRRRPRAKEKP